MSRMSRRHLDEHGLAAPLVVTLTGLLLVVTLIGGGLGQLLVDQRRVSAAADLAALAGAGAQQRGQSPCRTAALVAGRNGSTLVGCTVSGTEVVVRAAVRSSAFVGLLRLAGRSVSVEADARAGPVG